MVWSYQCLDMLSKRILRLHQPTWAIVSLPKPLLWLNMSLVQWLVGVIQNYCCFLSETLEFSMCRIIFEILGLCFHGSGRSYWKWQIQVIELQSESGLGEMQSFWRNANFLRSPAFFDLQGRASERQLTREVVVCSSVFGSFISVPEETAAFHTNREIYSHAKIFLFTSIWHF